MTVKLFQDVAGTIPAVLAGQPVGFIKRTKGSDDAKQATALSKPTLARHPKSGVRNLLGCNEVRPNELSPLIVGTWGVSGGIAEDSGDTFNGYRGIRVIGQGQDWHRIQGNTINQFPLVVGDVFTTSAIVKRGVSGAVTRGTIRAGLGLAVEASSVNSAGVYVEGTHSLPYGGGAVEGMVYTMTVANPSSEMISTSVSLRGLNVGEAIDIGFRVYDLQLERGAVPTPVQFNYGPNDITEPGVPDLWHLYNDGGDSLNVTLAAGTYGLASIGIDRQIVITTFVSDGTTPVNILRHERQLDVSYRLGAYSFAEELAIRDAWGRKYA